MGFWGAFSIFLVSIYSSSLFAATTVKTGEISKDSNFVPMIQSAIESGKLDESHIEFPVAHSNQTIKISKESFTSLPESSQVAITKYLGNEYGSLYGEANRLQAWVDTKANDLKSEPAMIRLGVTFDSLAASVWAEALLSHYAQTWAKKMSLHDGPNCYHTSIASIFSSWKNHRYMSPSEFECHLKTSFVEINESLKWGDLIGFWDGNRTPIHGFTYLGPDDKDPAKKIVFTKNGYFQGFYLYSTFDRVKQVYESYGISAIRYYRPVSEAIDPSEHQDAPCAPHYQAKWSPKLKGISDPIFEKIWGTKKWQQTMPSIEIRN